MYLGKSNVRALIYSDNVNKATLRLIMYKIHIFYMIYTSVMVLYQAKENEIDNGIVIGEVCKTGEPVISIKGVLNISKLKRL